MRVVIIKVMVMIMVMEVVVYNSRVYYCDGYYYDSIIEVLEYQ